MHTLALNGKMQELAEQLEKAVREEKYEDAAQIRDQIREMEAKWKKTVGAARATE